MLYKYNDFIFMLEYNHCFFRLDIHYVYCKCLDYGLVTDAFLTLICNQECCTSVKEQRLTVWHCQNTVQELGHAPLTVNGWLPMWVHPKFVLNYEIITFIINQSFSSRQSRTQESTCTVLSGTLCSDSGTKVWAISQKWMCD